MGLQVLLENMNRPGIAQRKQHVLTCLQVLLLESLQCVGVFLLLYIVLPSLDVFRSLFLLTAVATIPSLLQIFNQPQNKAVYKTLLDVSAFLIQLFALAAWLSLHLAQQRSSLELTTISESIH